MDSKNSAAQLRFYTLYFDNVCLVPFNLLVTPAQFLVCTTNEEQMLFQQEILSALSSRIIPFGSENDDFIVSDVERVFKRANNGQQGLWSVACPEDFADKNNTCGINALQLIIRDMLPSPSINVPISEVIQFRLEHQKELRGLHVAIDKIFLQYQHDELDTLPIIADEIRSHLEDVTRALKVKKFPFFRAGLSISKSIQDGVVPALAAGVGAALGLPPIISAMLGGAVTLAARSSLLAKNDNRYPKTFEYIYLANKNRILSSEEDGLFSGGVSSIGILNSLITSRMPPFVVQDMWASSPSIIDSIVVDQTVHDPRELAEYFQGWAKFAAVDNDVGIDAFSRPDD